MNKSVKVYIEVPGTAENYNFVKEYPIKTLIDIELIIDTYRYLHYSVKYNIVLDNILYLLFTEF